MHIFNRILPVAAVAALCACSSGTATVGEKSDSLPPIFPDYVGVTVPCNIAPLNFEVRGTDLIRAEFAVKGRNMLTVECRDGVADIPIGGWREMLAAAAADSVQVRVSAWGPAQPEGVEYKPFSFYVSPDSIDGWAAYRLIEPSYEGWMQMGIYQRDLSTFEEKVLVDNSVNNMGCVNCHTFADYSPERMLFHARGKDGGTVFFDGKHVEKVDLTQIGPSKQGVYPMWSRDGRYVVFSSNNTHQSFFGGHGQPLEVYDQGSDLMIYDTQSGKMIVDERFQSEDRWETFPAWTPDGRWLVFCSAEPHSMPLEREKVHYDILRVGFDPDTGLLGERVDTLYDARREGGSASFPRISPDGRFLMFAEADYGTFPVWHDEADMAMLRLEDGERMDVSALNSDRSESCHEWSSSGRWVLIGSRRLDGRYTRLFIAHVAEDGTCGKPFLLPQQNPEHNTWRLKSYNTPQFIRGEVRLPEKELKNLFK